MSKVTRGRSYINPSKPPLNLCFAIVMQAIEDAKNPSRLRAMGKPTTDRMSERLRAEAIQFLRDDPVAKGIVNKVAPSFDYNLILKSLVNEKDNLVLSLV